MEIQKIKEELASVKNKVIDYSKLINELKAKKADAVSAENEPLAKEIWILEQIIDIQKNYLEAFKNIKEKKFYDGWRLLEKAEIDIMFLKKHFSMVGEPYNLSFIDKAIVKFQSIYPYRFFFSTELIEREKECSICGLKYKLRNSCGHVTGQIYNGELCLWKVTKFDLVGVAIVENPVHKYAVAFLKGEDSEVEDNYDYSAIEYLTNVISDPFEEWNVEFVYKYVHHNYFNSYDPLESCPCNQSEKSYKDCCLKEKGVKSLFHEFVVNTPSKEVVLPKSIRFVR